MATTFTSSTLSSIYHDDYNENDNYHQILFNSGRALQARELTQLQTLIYEEMGRFGRNVFKEGAAVSSGGSAINSDLHFLKIASVNTGGAFADIPVGTVFQNPTTGVSAKVIRVEPLGGDFTYNTLYVQYINSGGAAISGEPATFGDGETIDSTNLDDSYELITETPNATGKAVRFDVFDGDFFVMGRFVHANAQSFLLAPYSNIVDAVVGFKVEQEVITVNDTTALYDNAGGLVNTASPGADRYRIKLTLTTEDQITSDDTFVFLARVENSKIVEEIQEADAYNKVNELLALRTNEESGDYIVNPFTVYFEDGTVNDSNLDLVVSAGTAYVNGYRVDNASPIKLNVPKSLETETIENDFVPVSYGNYFLVDECRGLPNLDFSEINLYNTVGGTGGIVGTARIRAIEEDGALHKAYVFDVHVDSDQDLSTARSIGTSSTDYLNLVLQGTSAVLNQTTENDLLFPTARPRPESFSDITMTVQSRQSQVATGGTITMSQLPVGEAYTDTTLWVVAADDESFQTISPTTSNGGRDAQISGLTSGKTYEVIYYYSKTATRKPKTLTSTTGTISLQTATDVNGDTYNYYDLGDPDIYQLDSVRDTNSAGIDMLARVTLDDGQRDNFYADGRLILNTQDDAPSQIYVNYQHFTRGSGDFYDATSYSIDYKNIPTHSLQDGTEVRLFNYLDFRPDKNDGTFSNIHELPRNGTNITADISYYLPRADKLIVTQEGDIQLLMGQQAERPQFKPTPDNALELYKIVLNANTLDENDLQSTPIEHKRYTMADIGKIEAKLDQLEEYTTLSLLELEQRMRPSLDSDGNERLESGAQVDDFSDQTGADTNNPDYAASIDPESRLVRPSVDEDNVRLIWDDALNPAGNNVVKNGDQVYLNYTSTQWAYQSLASRFVNINPFGLVDNVGTMKLSPSSDEWKESIEEAETALGGANKVDRKQAFLWNNWMWNWCGRSIEDLQLDYRDRPRNAREARQRQALYRNEKYNSTFSTVPSDTANGKYVSRVISSDTLRSVVNGRVVDLALVPWMRSRKVYFHAKGLKPNTKFTPFFDGQNVAPWCREEASFVRWADRTDDIGNQYRYPSLVAHPDGTSDLTADENGEVIGSFFIPNIKPEYYVTRYGRGRKKKRTYIRFRSGVREFKLLDINVNDWSAADSKCFAYYSALGAYHKRYNNILSNRARQQTLPWNNLMTRVKAYSASESRDLLNQVTAAQVSIVDPKLAGQYGSATSPLTPAALAGLDASGQMSQVLSDYINVNTNQFAGTQINPLSLPQNPMSQTFYVDNQFGVVLTELDLFFRAKDTTNLPVSIHLRPVENGKPSTSNIVPDSHVYLNPSQVTAIGESPQLSTIQASPTTFTFDEPVYLQPWTQYAIIVTSQSTEYELFSAKTKESVYGSTSRIVTTQPAPGSLYLPQNGVVWVESKDQDLMYKLTRASFDLGGGSLILRNTALPATMLDENPIRTTSGSSRVYVSHVSHGLEPGDTAFIDSCGDVNGILATNINGSHIIDSADLHGYTIDVGSNATGSGFGGGDRTLARKNKVFNIANPYVETIIPNFTSIDVSAKFTSGKFISETSTRYAQDAQYARVTPKQNVDFVKTKAIYNATAETSQLGAGVYSSYVKVDLKTSNDYVSPIIDLQRASLILAGYRLDDPAITPHIYPVDETQPYGGTAGSRHITTPVTLDEAAVGIDARLNVNLPEGADLTVYYRTAASDENIMDQRWVEQYIESPLPRDNDMTFREAQFLAGGQGGSMRPFNQVQMKYVMTGGGMAPTLKSAAVKYLAV